MIYFAFLREISAALAVKNKKTSELMKFEGFNRLLESIKSGFHRHPILLPDRDPQVLDKRVSIAQATKRHA